MPLFKTDEVLILKNVRPRLSNAGTNGKPLFYLIKLPSNGIRIKDEINIKHLVVATNCLKDSFCLRLCKKLLQSWSSNIADLKEHMNKEWRNGIVPTTHLFSELVPNEQRLVTNFSNSDFTVEEKAKYCYEDIESFIEKLNRKEEKFDKFAQADDLEALNKKLQKLSIGPHHPTPTAWGDYTELFMYLYDLHRDLNRIVGQFCEKAGKDHQHRLQGNVWYSSLMTGWIIIDNYQKNKKHNFRWEESGILLDDPNTLDGKARKAAEADIFTRERFLKLGVEPFIEFIRNLDDGIEQLYDIRLLDFRNRVLPPANAEITKRNTALQSIHGKLRALIKEVSQL